MNGETIDLVNSSESKGKDDESQDKSFYTLVIETLQSFGINSDDYKDELKFISFDLSKYQEGPEKSVFGEKQSVSYTFHFVTYNVKFMVKLLAFHYDNKAEILKLDIEPKIEGVKKELEYCCNSLQRRRNLRLMFSTLILFSRFIEARRLVCELVLKKESNIKIEQNRDGGIIVVYSDDTRDVKLAIFWSISCSSTHEVTDVIEVYYKTEELQNKDEIKVKLEQLTHPNLAFNDKYHHWKNLLHDLSPNVSNNSKNSVTPLPAARCPSTESGASISTNNNECPSSSDSVIILDPSSDTESRRCSVETMDTTESSEAESIILVSDTEEVNLNSNSTQRALTANSNSARANFLRINEQIIRPPNQYYPSRTLPQYRLLSSYPGALPLGANYIRGADGHITLVPQDQLTSFGLSHYRTLNTFQRIVGNQYITLQYLNAFRRFMGLNFDRIYRVPSPRRDVVPSKRPRIGNTDDELQITSVTYVVPD